MASLVAPTLANLAFIACNMRQADRSEIYNVIGHNNPFILAGQTLDATGMGVGCVAYAGSLPVGVIGACGVHPGVCCAFAYGTDDFPRVALSLTRYALTVIRPWLKDQGFHRLECKSRFDHVHAHRWLRLFGMANEGTLTGYGSDGSDYFQFGVSTHVLRKNAKAQEAAASAQQAGYDERCAAQ